MRRKRKVRVGGQSSQSRRKRKGIREGARLGLASWHRSCGAAACDGVGAVGCDGLPARRAQAAMRQGIRQAGRQAGRQAARKVE